MGWSPCRAASAHLPHSLLSRHKALPDGTLLQAGPQRLARCAALQALSQGRPPCWEAGDPHGAGAALSPTGGAWDLLARSG